MLYTFDRSKNKEKNCFREKGKNKTIQKQESKSVESN